MGAFASAGPSEPERLTTGKTAGHVLKGCARDRIAEVPSASRRCQIGEQGDACARWAGGHPRLL